MMKILLLLVALFTSLSSVAQDTIGNKKGGRKKMMAFKLSPDYSMRTLKNNSGAATNDNIIRSRNKTEIPKLGFTTGVTFCFPVKSSMEFETGLQYSNKGYKTKEMEYYFQPGPNPIPDGSIKFFYSYHYADIPFKLSIITGKGKVQWIISAGLTVNILIKANSRNIFEENGNTRTSRSTTTSNFKALNISPMIGTGVDWALTNNMFLRVQPQFRYGLLKMTDTPVTEFLWNAGLAIGFYYSLK